MALEYYTDFCFTAFPGFIPKLLMYMNEKGFDEIIEAFSASNHHNTLLFTFLYVAFRLPHDTLLVKHFLIVFENPRNSCNSNESEDLGKLTETPRFFYGGFLRQRVFII